MPVTTPFYVVFDANIIIRDFWMCGPSFSYLLTHQFLQHRPVIPEVAFLEARNQLRERAHTLLSHRDHGEGSRGNTLRLLRLFNYKRLPARGEWNVDKLLERWEKHLRRVIKHFGGKIIPSPSVELSEITRRSIERRRPFSRGDKGFRDTLIWLSTLELLSPESRVSFITSNTSDFFSEDGTQPHPELVAEADRELRGEWKVLFHRSLDDFIAHFDSDRAASGQALQRALISNTLSGFDLWQWLEDNLLSMLGDDDFDMVAWAGVPPGAEAPVLVEIEQLVGLDIPCVCYLTADTYRLYCDLAFLGQFTCAVGYNAAESIIHPNQILWKDETDRFWTDVGMRIAATVLIALDFDAARRMVTSSFWITLPHWSSYQAAIDRLESIRLEINALAPPEDSNE